MNTRLMTLLAAQQAWEEMQAAYGLLFFNDLREVPEDDKKAAEQHLKKCNDWLTALRKGEG